jgi:hypothetical protein
MLLVLAAASAPAASARTFSLDKPIYFIHGIQPDSGTDCAKTWGLAIGAFSTWSGIDLVKAKLARTVGYYYRDTSCNTKIWEHGDHAAHYGGAFNAWHRKGGGHTADVRIEHLGYHLAWDIYDRYSKRDKAVDVVAHSMGGLIIRYALMQTALHSKEFPPYLLVEDVVTMGTPHGGSRLPESATVEDQQMKQKSPFLNRLARYGYLPVGRGGTDWMTMGSGADKLVSADSASGSAVDATGKRVSRYIGSPHKALYTPADGLGHSDYYRAISPAFDAEAILSLAGGPFNLTSMAPWPVRLAYVSIINANI